MKITTRQLRAAEWSLAFDQKNPNYLFQVYTTDVAPRMSLVKMKHAGKPMLTEFRVIGKNGWKRSTDSPFTAVRYYNEDEGSQSPAAGTVESIRQRKDGLR